MVEAGIYIYYAGTNYALDIIDGDMIKIAL